MPTYPTQFFSSPFAENGDKTIIGADPVATGRASLPLGFPPITATPIAQGGIAPQREDFNGILYMLSAFAFWQQSGGMWQYNSNLDYTPPAIVFYSGKYWQCVQACSADAPVTPGTNAAYWRPLPQFLFQSYPVSLSGDASGNGTTSASGLNVPVTVNQAARLTQPMTMTFQGDVTGSVTFDGSKNVAVTLTGGADANPVGTVIMYWGSSAPDGYFVCNGGTFDGAAYPQLKAVLGSTTLPDLRNQFIRGSSPGSRNTGTRETDAGRNITGAFYSDARFYGDGAPIMPTGPFSITAGIQGTRAISATLTPTGQQMNFNAQNVWGADHTATEFRPTNTALLFCIKHD